MAGDSSGPAGWIRKILDQLRTDSEDKAAVAAPAAGSSEHEWQLILKPAVGRTTEEQAGAPADEPSVEPPAWRDAAEAVRTTVKWLVAAFAVVGALMFAKGFITTPKLSWEDNRTQLLWALLLGVLGLLAIGYFLFKAVTMLRPAVYDLHDLGASLPKFIAIVNNGQDKYLPEGVSNFDQFRAAYGTARRSVVSASDNRDQASRALKRAKEENPPNADIIKKAEEELEWWEDIVVKTRRSFNAMKTVRTGLLNKAEYWNSSTAFDRNGLRMVIAALVAAVGGIGYQLALATPDESANAKVSSPAAAVVVGELIGNDSAASSALWEELGLSRCQADVNFMKIAVIVTSGNGSTQDPYVVSTIPTQACPVQTFAVIDAVARVSLPGKTEISYTPAPTTRPS